MRASYQIHQSIVALLFMILILDYVSVVKANKNCLENCVCVQDKFEQVMFCYENADLKQIPPQISGLYKGLTIQKNNFRTLTIRKSNMTGLLHLISLKIIYCHLEKIESGAFEDMKLLKTLDLSYNNIKTIMPYTFKGLDLNALHLSSNYGLELVKDSLKLSYIRKLNLRSCKINQINSRQFTGIGLREIFLFNNTIKTVDSGFADMLTDTATYIDLSDNPLTCDCRLRWLLTHLQTRDPKVLKHINVTCKRPRYLVGQSLVKKISFKQRRELENKMKCREPKVTGLSIEFGELGKSAVLKCSSDIDSNEVQKDTRMLWYFEDNGRFINIPQKPVSPYNTRDSVYGSNSQSVQSNTKTVAVNVTFPANKIQHTFKCRTYNPNNLYSTSLSMNTDLNSNNPQQELLLHIRTPENFVNPPETTEITKSPIDNEENTTILQPQSYVHKKQFTILEMIGVVIGTFVITIFMLLVIGHCIKHYSGCFWRFQKSTTPIKPFITTTPNLNTTFPVSSATITGLDYNKPSQQTQHQYNISTTPNLIHKNHSNSQKQPTPQFFNFPNYHHQKLVDNNHSQYSQTIDNQNHNINSDTISNEYDIPRICETTHNFAPPLPIFDHIEYLDFKNPSSKLFTTQ